MCSSFSVLLRIRTSNREEHKHRGQARANNSGGWASRKWGNRGVKFIGRWNIRFYYTLLQYSRELVCKACLIHHQINLGLSNAYVF